MRFFRGGKALCISNFSGVRKGGFVAREADGEPCRHFHEDGSEQAESGLRKALDTKGAVRDLARSIAQAYRRVVAPTAGQTLTLDQRRKMRDQIIAEMGGEGDSAAQQTIRELASLLAGLSDELADSGRVEKGIRSFSSHLIETDCPFCRKVTTLDLAGKTVKGLQPVQCPHCHKSYQQDFSARLEKRAAIGDNPGLAEVMADLRGKLEVLKARINELVERRTAAAPVTFRANANGDGVAREHLNKALANPKPAHYEGDVSKSSFQTKEAVAPGIPVHIGSPNSPDVRKRTKFEPITD